MSESRQWKMATFLFVFFNVPENRTQETEKRRTFSSVSLLCTVISKSSRPIGARKSLGYCKSLDCVAGVFRGIEKMKKRGVKGREKKRTPFFISSSFPFTPLPLFSRFCTCYANCRAGYCVTYIFTLTWLWFDCSTVRIRIAVHLYEDGRYVLSSNLGYGINLRHSNQKHPETLHSSRCVWLTNTLTVLWTDINHTGGSAGLGHERSVGGSTRLSRECLSLVLKCFVT